MSSWRNALKMCAVTPVFKWIHAHTFRQSLRKHIVFTVLHSAVYMQIDRRSCARNETRELERTLFAGFPPHITPQKVVSNFFLQSKTGTFFEAHWRINRHALMMRCNKELHLNSGDWGYCDHVQPWRPCSFSWLLFGFVVEWKEGFVNIRRSRRYLIM